MCTFFDNSKKNINIHILINVEGKIIVLRKYLKGFQYIGRDFIYLFFF